MAKRLELPKFQAFDVNGDPLSGGLVYTYENGTTTLKTSYSDSDASTPNANPVVLDSRGEADIYIIGTYTIVLKTSAGVTIWTLDNVQGGQGDEAAMEGFYYPDASATDQGVTGASNTIKYAVDTITTDSATIYLRHDSGAATTTYTLTTSETIPEDTSLIIENGAILDGAGTLTMAYPGQVVAEKDQQIYGSSITVVFTNAGIGHPGRYYGCDLTGATDSAGAVNDCVTSLPSGVLDLKGLTLRIDSTIDLKSDMTVEGYGGSIDFSNATSGDYLFNAEGSAATARDVDTSVTQGDENIEVTNASTYYTADDWTWIADDDAWGANSSKMGEWAHIIKVNTTVSVDLGSDLLYAYTTGANAKLSVITFVENLYVKGITATGAADGDFFLYVGYGKNINITDCHISDFEARGIRLDYTIQFNVSNNKIFRSNASGTGYGVALVACANGTISDNYLEECRHGVSIGGTVFPTRYVTMKNNYVQSPTDAGLDAHEACEYCTWDGNHIQGGETAGITADGIVVQGANATIINNIIIGVEDHGINIQNMVDNDSIPSSYTISGNYIERAGDGTNGNGIFVEQWSGGDGPIKGLTITNNTIKKCSNHGIFVYARTADIDNVNISGNNIMQVASASDYNIWVYALTGFAITNGVISNNISARNDDSDNNIKLQAADATSITYFAISGNSIINGSVGIACTNEDYVAITGNVINGCTANISEAGANNVEANNIGA